LTLQYAKHTATMTNLFAMHKKAKLSRGVLRNGRTAWQSYEWVMLYKKLYFSFI